MDQIFARIMLTEEELQARIAEMGKTLSEDYDGKTPILICILKGAVHFFSDLTKNISVPCEYDFLSASSYGSATVSSGTVKLTKDASLSLEGRHVIIVDDILDTGHTLKFVKEHLLAKNPASLKLCVLLDKPSRRTEDITYDYAGFTIENEFVVGYGLDYNELYRNIPYIGVLKPEVYSK